MGKKTWALMVTALLVGAGLAMAYIREGWLDMFLFGGIAVSLAFYLAVKS